ncbi:MAG: hypothetical protein OZ948_04895 [Deltaproteobacteria bacterium]|nr:hypothetical protein [Deltaproteobacteria bacterium]
MIDPALRKLRLDRRMLDRRGWIGQKDLERALAELPDVSAKVAPTEDAPEPGESPAPDAKGEPR